LTIKKIMVDYDSFHQKLNGTLPTHP